MDVIKNLSDFIEVAQRNRKYPVNSVYGYRAALKLFDEEINTEERGSLDLFKERFEQIYSNIVSRRKNTFSMSSLEVYKKRVKKILDDYERYGVDPSKMANWNPVILKRATAGTKSKDIGNSPSEESNISRSFISPVDNSKHEYSLRDSKKIIISYPSDFTVEEAKSIQSFAEYLISMRGGDQR